MNESIWACSCEGCPMKNSIFKDPQNQYIQLDPEAVLHPGQVLEEYLHIVGFSLQNLAPQIGMTPEHIDDMICGIVPITEDDAIRMEQPLMRPAQFWIDLQRNYDLALHAKIIKAIDYLSRSKEFSSEINKEKIREYLINLSREKYSCF